MKVGKFISFEGIDGSGKSTQIKSLQSKLSLLGEECSVYREPGGTIISEKIRQILLDKNNLDLSDRCESLLFFASRNQLLRQRIIPDLNKGLFVLCDRFNDSTIAYQGYGENRDVESLNKTSSFATEGRQPDITFYLDIEVDLSIERRKLLINDRIEEKGLDYLGRVRKGFLELAEKESERIIVIDGSLDEELISNKIWGVLKEKYDFKD